MASYPLALDNMVGANCLELSHRPHQVADLVMQYHGSEDATHCHVEGRTLYTGQARWSVGV